MVGFFKRPAAKDEGGLDARIAELVAARGAVVDGAERPGDAVPLPAARQCPPRVADRAGSDGLPPISEEDRLLLAREELLARLTPRSSPERVQHSEPRRSRQGRRCGGAGLFCAQRDRAGPDRPPRSGHRADQELLTRRRRRRPPTRRGGNSANALGGRGGEGADPAARPRAHGRRRRGRNAARRLRGAAHRLGQGPAGRNQDPAEFYRAARAGRVADRRHARASARSSRCSTTRPSPTSWSTGRGRSMSSGAASSN